MHDRAVLTEEGANPKSDTVHNSSLLEPSVEGELCFGCTVPWQSYLLDAVLTGDDVSIAHGDKVLHVALEAT